MDDCIVGCYLDRKYKIIIVFFIKVFSPHRWKFPSTEFYYYVVPTNLVHFNNAVQMNGQYQIQSENPVRIWQVMEEKSVVMPLYYYYYLRFYTNISPLNKHAGYSLCGAGVDDDGWLIWQMSCLLGKVSRGW